jgi:hypothetical protein
MGTGEFTNQWGNITNANLSTVLEQAIAGAAAVNIPDANVILTVADGTPDQARQMGLVFVGALTQTRTVFAPQVTKLYVLVNDTTGGQGVTISTAASSATITVPNGKSAMVYCDGTNFYSATQYVDDLEVNTLTVGGLTNPLPVTSGGTGGNTPAAARLNLGAAASGPNSDITAITGLLTPLAVSQGGTGGTIPSTARSNLGAAASGNNTDITQLSGLTTDITLAQGGTGATLTPVSGGVVYSGPSVMAITPVGIVGQVLSSAGASAPVWTNLSAAIPFIVDGGGLILTTGVQGYIQIPFNCTILSATMLADQTGSIVVDIWKDTYANFPPLVADSICGVASKPTITAGIKYTDSALTGWNKTINAGDILAFNIDSVATITRVTISLTVTRA